MRRWLTLGNFYFQSLRVVRSFVAFPQLQHIKKSIYYCSRKWGGGLDKSLAAARRNVTAAIPQWLMVDQRQLNTAQAATIPFEIFMKSKR